MAQSEYEQCIINSIIIVHFIAAGGRRVLTIAICRGTRFLG